MLQLKEFADLFTWRISSCLSWMVLLEMAPPAVQSSLRLAMEFHHWLSRQAWNLWGKKTCNLILILGLLWDLGWEQSKWESRFCDCRRIEGWDYLRCVLCKVPVSKLTGCIRPVKSSGPCKIQLKSATAVFIFTWIICNSSEINYYFFWKTEQQCSPNAGNSVKKKIYFLERKIIAKKEFLTWWIIILLPCLNARLVSSAFLLNIDYALRHATHLT